MPRRRVVRAAALLVTAVSCAAVAWGANAVARATSTVVERADAVVVHADNPIRLEAAQELVARGAAPTLVVSDVPGGYGLDRAGRDRLCGTRRPYEVVCVTPVPVTTLGEARAFGRLAAARGWETVAVVTDRGHLARAAASDAQCTDARLLPVAADPTTRIPAREVLVEALALLATLTVARAC